MQNYLPKDEKKYFDYKKIFLDRCRLSIKLIEFVEYRYSILNYHEIEKVSDHD